MNKRIVAIIGDTWRGQPFASGSIFEHTFVNEFGKEEHYYTWQLSVHNETEFGEREQRFDRARGAMKRRIREHRKQMT